MRLKSGARVRCSLAPRRAAAGERGLRSWRLCMVGATIGFVPEGGKEGAIDAVARRR